MMQRRCWATALLALSLALPLAAAEFRGLEREMSPEERARTGVDRLNAEQRAALDTWLKQRFAAEMPALASAPAAMAAVPATPAAVATPRTSAIDTRAALSDASQIGFSHYTGEREEFSARIVGSFSGWTGRTRFRLDNGQVWQQNESGTYEISLENPTVRLRPKALGSWLLLLQNNRGIRVRRVE